MRPVTLNLPSESGQIVNTGGCLTVHATRETTGSAAAVYRLWDGVSNESTLLLPISLSAGESTRDDFRDHHIRFQVGLYFELVSGALEGSVSVLVDHQCEWCIEMMLHALLADEH